MDEYIFLKNSQICPTLMKQDDSLSVQIYIHIEENLNLQNT